MKTPKTPPNLRANARNYHRRKKGVPVEAPLHTRAEPFNRKRKGTGNITRKISMPEAAWDLLDGFKGGLTRGEWVNEQLSNLSS